MELQFKKTSCRYLDRVVHEYSSQELTQEVRLPEGMPDIGRVLASWGQMVLRSKEWQGDTVSLIGGVTVWVLYAPEDGSAPRCVDTWLPYQLRWDHLDAQKEGPVRVNPILRFVDARTVAARKMMIRVGAAALAEAMCPAEAAVYTPDELPEDAQILRRAYPIRIPRELGEKTFQLDEELNHSGPEVNRIISYVLHPQITDRRVLSNKLVFRGCANLHMIYCCSEGRIRTQDFELPFSQYAELEDIHSSDAQADIWLAATNVELDSDDQNKFRLKCGMVAQYLVDDREMIELAQDAYSNRRHLEPVMESLMLPAILEDRIEKVSPEQHVSGHSGEMVDISFLPDIPVHKRSSDALELEQPGIFQILYYDENGTLQSANARASGRINLTAGEGTAMDACVVSQIQPRASSTADGFSLDTQMQMMIRTTSNQGIPMVTGLEAGEMRNTESDRPSLILCRPEGEGLWELAKRCGSTVDVIRNANGLVDEPEHSRILLIPVS